VAAPASKPGARPVLTSAQRTREPVTRAAAREPVGKSVAHEPLAAAIDTPKAVAVPPVDKPNSPTATLVSERRQLISEVEDSELDYETEQVPPPPRSVGYEDQTSNRGDKDDAMGSLPPPSGSHVGSGAHHGPTSVVPPSHGSHMGPMMHLPQGSMYPLSIAPPPPTWSMARWLGAVVITAVASFVLGLLMASGGLQVRIVTGGEPSATSPPVAAQPPVAATAPAPAASVAKSADAPAPAPAPVATTAADDDDGSSLPLHKGYLIVDSEFKDAHVYILGQHRGRVGEKLEVNCGLVHVRLGTRPLLRWYGAGEGVPVACRGVTRINFRPRASVPWPGGNAGGNRWMPGDL
jgi:hypothetical protein